MPAGKPLCRVPFPSPAAAPSSRTAGICGAWQEQEVAQVNLSLWTSLGLKKKKGPQITGTFPACGSWSCRFGAIRIIES